MKNKKTKKAIVVITMFVIFILGILVGNLIEKNKENKVANEEETTRIVEVEVGMQTIENTLTSSGEIECSGTENLALNTSKYFQAMCVEENDIVKPGMLASCEILLEKAEDCIAVPIEAVQTKDNEKYVVVVDENENTENVSIETGISNDSYVQVLSGLIGGETIQITE